ncbi:MAG TPA: hypothetical protein PLD59_06025 [Tepidisphaeraceae bacterium]|nr:hypothetical protein [Tepidisphaeraceae bacterium]
MPERKAFLLRIDPAILDAIQKWADDDLRSMNGQIEFLLRQALIDRRRIKTAAPTNEPLASEPPPTID